jgi:hypothetical protein
MDKIIGNDIDINTINNLNLANLNFLNSYKDLLNVVELMHQNLTSAQLFDNDENLQDKVTVSDEIISEMSLVAQQFIKITFLLDKLENLHKQE